ncbi:GFA family protein [Sandaracinus amylolyticus]|uniref:GFA family protein n=1 Tax=Sandaracinus amylolyticus TaxID=927083 RepID=UPI001F273C41|nr:GFA family protein [Sandaracinus amylolyticus]UJR84667.1 Hypothetical protein I5071_67460 [Sandaracinus amylolyticus]
MLTGSCACRAVRYEIAGELGPIVFCHCGDCRKAQGGAFAVTAPVRTSELRFVSGEDALEAYPSSPGKERVFCRRCGSPIISRRAARPDVARLRLGTLDTAIDARPVAHIFVASKAPWFEITDGLPQYAEYEPTR